MLVLKNWGPGALVVYVKLWESLSLTTVGGDTIRPISGRICVVWPGLQSQWKNIDIFTGALPFNFNADDDKSVFLTLQTIDFFFWSCYCIEAEYSPPCIKTNRICHILNHCYEYSSSVFVCLTGGAHMSYEVSVIVCVESICHEQDTLLFSRPSRWWWQAKANMKYNTSYVSWSLRVWALDSVDPNVSLYWS